MGEVVFGPVWLRRSKRPWWPPLALTYEDVGSLQVLDGSLTFRGESTISISQIRRISFGFRGADITNRWIEIEYGDRLNPGRVLLKDGGSWGWRGILGGTQKMLKAVERETGVSYEEPLGIQGIIRFVLVLLSMAAVPLMIEIAFGYSWIGFALGMLIAGSLGAEAVLNRIWILHAGTS